MNLRPLIERMSALPRMSNGTNRLVILLGLLADFDSFEYLLVIRKILPKLAYADMKILVIAIGNQEGLKNFCESIDFPIEYIHLEENSDLHNELKLDRGLKTNFGFYADLLLMCARYKSPGTLNEVIRGYIGDKNSINIFSHNIQ